MEKNKQYKPKLEDSTKEKIINRILKGDERPSGDFSYDEMCEAIDEGHRYKLKISIILILIITICSITIGIII